MKTIEDHGTTWVAAAETGMADGASDGLGRLRQEEAGVEMRDCGDRNAGQLELGLRAVAAPRPRRMVRGRRYVAARWWFAQMREAVRATPEWAAGSRLVSEGGEQALLSLTQGPTRLERRHWTV